MFINFSNHPSAAWSLDQKQAADQNWGEIRDIPFPQVEPEAGKEEVRRMAGEAVKAIVSMKPDCVMCQGEFTLAYQVICGLRKAGIMVVAACSRRSVTEEKADDKVIKKSEYRFAGFREYEEM